MQTAPLLSGNNNVASSNSKRAKPKPVAHDDTNLGRPAHSGRLVYAKPQDLPSYPSVGLKANGSAASAAATLGWATKSSPEIWKPADKCASASAAAVLAKDYKMAPSWEPSASNHGAKAALLAHQAAKNSSGPWKPASPPPANNPHSAATIAFRSDRNAPRPAQASPDKDLSKRGSLSAAKGAMSLRQRATSSPDIRPATYPDEANAASNALAAATRAHKAPQSPSSDSAGAVPYTKMDRRMFTSTPPVKPETDDQKRQDVLHASAIAMAKKMYNQQQKIIEERRARGEDDDAASDGGHGMGLGTLQDAAYRQAQLRLAKLHEDNMKNREYKEYYGAEGAQRRFSVRGKLRKRSNSDSDMTVDDKKRSEQIRQQMSIFSTKLSQVDDKKRQEDRDALLAAAHKNVQAKLKGMDQKISAETGMVAPSTLTQWELKAHAAAQARSYDRASGVQNGKVDVGAGLQLDKETIDAIAAKRVQPVLDEINEKAEKEHARLAELKLEADRKKQEQEAEKARQREIDDLNRKLKESEKLQRKEQRAAEKEEARLRKEEAKAARAELKQAKADKRKSIPEPIPAVEEDHEELVARTGTVTMNSSGQPVNVPPRPESQIDAVEAPEEVTDPDAKSPTDEKRGRRISGWFKSRFVKGNKSPDEMVDNKSKRKSFIRGISLPGVDRNNGSSTSLSRRNTNEPTSALASPSTPAPPAASFPTPKTEDAPKVSLALDRRDTTNVQEDSSGDDASLMDSSSDDEFFRDEARDRRSGGLSPPRPIRGVESVKSEGSQRDSRFQEMM